MMADDATEYQVARHLEAYILWLFGWVMFTSAHGNSVDARLIEYARQIADSDPQDIPQYSWGSAVLCGTYRALCDAVVKTGKNSVFAGCPLLVQLWCFERSQIGRPHICTDPYGLEMYGATDVDKPTVGSLWCRSRVTN